jgi:hypothetical protein
MGLGEAAWPGSVREYQRVRTAPVAFVNLAGDLDCQHISIGLVSFGYNPHEYPAFSLKDDASLRRDDRNDA